MWQLNAKSANNLHVASEDVDGDADCVSVSLSGPVCRLSNEAGLKHFIYFTHSFLIAIVAVVIVGFKQIIPVFLCRLTTGANVSTLTYVCECVRASVNHHLVISLNCCILINARLQVNADSPLGDPFAPRL